MKQLLTAILLFVYISVFSQSAIFLHHSTGGGVWNGGVPQWISDFNDSTSYTIQAEERAYPNSPYPWANYAYDYWHLWLNNGCDNAEAGIECIRSIADNYDLVIYKHCFPGAAIAADGTPDITSSSKTIANYKLQYRALRAMMDTMPDTKFMVWTLAPLHRNSTDSASAARAKQFVDWVNNDWLTEDAQAHDNIYIFDFFSYAAELDDQPANGAANCLKYDYEKDHAGSDSHPNTLANETIAPFFAAAIVNALLGTNFQIEQKSTLQVNNGTGSGSYLEGESVTISATSPQPGSGQEFDCWTGDVSYLDDVHSAATTLTMPAENIRITATYKNILQAAIFNEKNELYNVYPNPSSNGFTFTTNNNSLVDIQILDAGGNLLFSKAKISNLYFGENLFQGSYLLSVNYEGNTSQTKIIKR